MPSATLVERSELKIQGRDDSPSVCYEMVIVQPSAQIAAGFFRLRLRFGDLGWEGDSDDRELLERRATSVAVAMLEGWARANPR